LPGAVHRTRESACGHRGFHLQPRRGKGVDVDPPAEERRAGLRGRRKRVTTLGIWRGARCYRSGRTASRRMLAPTRAKIDVRRGRKVSSLRSLSASSHVKFASYPE
jgi:hypothetical protein